MMVVKNDQIIFYTNSFASLVCTDMCYIQEIIIILHFKADMTKALAFSRLLVFYILPIIWLPVIKIEASQP